MLIFVVYYYIKDFNIGVNDINKIISISRIQNIINIIYVEADDFLKVISEIVIYLIIRKNVFSFVENIDIDIFSMDFRSRRKQSLY